MKTMKTLLQAAALVAGVLIGLFLMVYLAAY